MHSQPVKYSLYIVEHMYMYECYVAPSVTMFCPEHIAIYLASCNINGHSSFIVT